MMRKDDVERKEIQENLRGKNNDGLNPSEQTPSSTSRQWSAFRDPRIVRVSRHFGGKDRHSKVCTIRGLRDRRIRLSVPTAIQIYDLQFKLGLGQPSKVIDWLLDASKDDIDMLPPLPTIPQGFTQFHTQMHVNSALLGHVANSSFVPFFDVNNGRTSTTTTTTPLLTNNSGSHIKMDNNVGGYDHDIMMSRTKYWNIEECSREQHQRGVSRNHDVEGKWIDAFSSDNNHQEGCSSFGGQGQVGQVPLAQNFFPMSNSSWPSLLANGANSHSQWEPSNLTLSPFNNATSNDAMRYQSSLQPLIYPSAAAQSQVHNHGYITNTVEGNTRQLDHFQLLNSSSQNLPFSLDVNDRLMLSQYNSTRESHTVKNNTNDS